MSGRPDPWLGASRLLPWGLAALAVAVHGRYGMGWDSQVQAQYGDAVLGWWTSGFRDRSALELLDLRTYGGLFEAVAQLAVRLSPLGKYETRHLLTALTGVLGIAAAGRLAARVGGARARFLAMALLAAMPAWWGHAFVNSKDIPFAAASGWALVALLATADALPGASWRRWGPLGLALGAALGIRPGAAAWLLALSGTALGVAAIRAARREGRPGEILGKAALAFAAATALVAWPTMLLCWPWGQVSPILHPLEAIATAARFPFGGVVRWEGALVEATRLPRGYVAASLLGALPEAWLLALAAGGVAGAAALRRGVRGLPGPVLLLGAAAFGPLAAAAALHATAYDGFRHFLFVLVPLAALAGGGAAAALAVAPRGAALGLGGALAATIGLVVVEAGVLHPYEYVYANHLAGGLAAAAARTDADYWGLSYREATLWVLANVAPPPGRALRLATCARPFQAGYWVAAAGASDRFEVVWATEEPDLLLATTRYDCHLAPGRTLHVVEREGTPLAWVIDRRPEAAAEAGARPAEGR